MKAPWPPEISAESPLLLAASPPPLLSSCAGRSGRLRPSSDATATASFRIDDSSSQSTMLYTAVVLQGWGSRSGLTSPNLQRPSSLCRSQCAALPLQLGAEFHAVRSHAVPLRPRQSHDWKGSPHRGGRQRPAPNGHARLHADAGCGRLAKFVNLHKVDLRDRKQLVRR